MKKKICIVIPCYRVREEIKNVLNKIDYKIVDKVFVIDDACPQNSGLLVKNLNLEKIEVIFSKKNLGVGGATLLGFKKALNDEKLLVWWLNSWESIILLCEKIFWNIVNQEITN